MKYLELALLIFWPIYCIVQITKHIYLYRKDQRVSQQWLNEECGRK